MSWRGWLERLLAPRARRGGRRRLVALALLAVSGALAAWNRNAIARRLWGRTEQEVVADLAVALDARWQERCAAAGVAYPPRHLALVAFKQEQRLEAWADGRRIAAYPFTGSSGGPGPKLRAGDGQIPEGIYAVEGLNPNSRFHLSIRLDYPNDFDRRMAAREHREELGDDIFIHGGSASVGCIPIGDDAIEELFLLVHRTGAERCSVLVAPWDLRERPGERPRGAPAWTGELYAQLERRLRLLGRFRPWGADADATASSASR